MDTVLKHGVTRDMKINIFFVINFDGIYSVYILKVVEIVKYNA